MKKTCTLPPTIIQKYNSALLTMPTPKFRDTSDIFETMLIEVKKMWKKLDACPKKKERCERLMMEIMELYERAKIKEKEREKEKDHKTQGFGYSVARNEKAATDVYYRLRFGRKAGRFS